MDSWIEYKSLFDNDLAARQMFVEICDNVVRNYYFDKKVFALSELSNIDNPNKLQAKELVLYLAKYFTEEINNSRKGQIRKAFNQNIDFIKKYKSKIKECIVCLPKQLSENEQNWWSTWTKKMKDNYGINIQLFDGDELLRKIRQFDIDKKFFPKEEKIYEIDYQDEWEDTDEDFIEIIEKNHDQTIPQKTDITTQDIVKNVLHEENKPTEQKINKEKTTKSKEEKITQNQKLTTNDAKNRETELPVFNKLYEQFKELKQKIEKLDYDLKGLLKHRNSIDFDKIFTEIPTLSSLANRTPEDILHKANHERSAENYDKALYLYEYLDTRNDKDKISLFSLKSGKKQSEKHVEYNNYLLEGDYYYITGNYIKAIEAYEKAMKIFSHNSEIKTKYHEAFGDALSEKGLLKQALEQYNKALYAQKSNVSVRKKVKFVKNILNSDNVFKKKPASLLNPIFRPYFMIKARSYDISTPYFNKKFSEFVKKSIFSIFILIIFIVGAYFVIDFASNIHSSVNKNNIAAKAVTPFELQLKQAQKYEAFASQKQPIYYDSAIISYQRALRYRPYSKDIPRKIDSLKKEKYNFIKMVQYYVRRDSSYFVSMRKESEGLKLFKFIYEPQKDNYGKYGYMDTNKNVIIPPVFDFDYKKMLMRGESFTNGKALVAHICTNGDTIYFYIDRRGRKIKRLSVRHKP